MLNGKLLSVIQLMNRFKTIDPTSVHHHSVCESRDETEQDWKFEIRSKPIHFPSAFFQVNEPLDFVFEHNLRSQTLKTARAFKFYYHQTNSRHL